MITKEQIFKSLVHGWPNCPCSLPNEYDDFDVDVIWHDSNSYHPKLSEIEEYYKSIDYIEKRIENYPTTEVQLDILYDQGYEGWKAFIKNIKDRFPKP